MSTRAITTRRVELRHKRASTRGDRPGAGARQGAQAAGLRARPRLRRSLEIGAGTGYFSLNLLQAGAVREATCTDISPGMRGTLRSNADRLG